MTLADELTGLTKLKRSARNLDKVKDAIEVLREYTESASSVLSAVAEIQSALDVFTDVLDDCGDDNPFVGSWISGIRDAAGEFAQQLPDADPDDVESLTSDLESAAEEYENSLDDREYSKEDREELWGEILNSVDTIVNMIGVPAQDAKEVH